MLAQPFDGVRKNCAATIPHDHLPSTSSPASCWFASVKIRESAVKWAKRVTEAIDTSGPAGRMLMQMLGSFAEFERAMVGGRTRAGLKAATARGWVALADPDWLGRVEDRLNTIS